MLSHSLVTAKSAEPRRFMLFLHGILGTRANWRGIARRFTEARPDWGAVLVDLREHGDSLGLVGPHTIAEAAADVRRLEEGLGVSVGGALGHSFGGKVTLEWLRARGGTPTEAWVIDASPSAHGHVDDSATTEVLRVLSTLPKRWDSREAFVSAVVEAGQPEPIAQWLAMNLRRTNDGKREVGPDLQVIQALVEDYARTDLWDVVDSPPEPCTLDVVIGDRSAAFSAADRERIRRIAARNPRVSTHLVERAGHWVHVDAPDVVVALLTSGAGPTR